MTTTQTQTPEPYDQSDHAKLKRAELKRVIASEGVDGPEAEALLEAILAAGL